MFEMRDDCTLVVGSSSPLRQDLQLDLRSIYLCESRIHEVAIVTPTKAPELLSEFNRGWLEAKKVVARLQFELHQAVTGMKQVKSRLVLDEIPGILLAKGLVTEKNKSGSEDLREMVLMTKPEYVDACDRVAALEVAIQFIRDKADALEMAYTSVKKLLGEGGGSNPFHRSNPSLSGGGSKEDLGAPSQPSPRYTGFGTPTYNRE